MPNAWTKGSTNPITQRPVGASTPNGVQKQSAQKAMARDAAPDKQAQDRLMFLYANFNRVPPPARVRPPQLTVQGLQCVVSLVNNDKYSGIFSSVMTDANEARYLLKMVKKLGAADGKANGVADDPYVGTGPDHALAFMVGEVVDLHVAGVRLDKAPTRAAANGACSPAHLFAANDSGSSRFRTDVDISGGIAARERDLERWDAGPETAVDLSLGAKSNGQDWDQFEANERIFGLTTNYDESFYTTTIDKSHPQYKEREARAARQAREIEGSAAINSHVAEERGLKMPEDNGEDEEAKYSGVRRDVLPLATGQPNKYTPPARRAPSGRPTVPGAPVDPAIISSSLARPEKAETLKAETDLPPKITQTKPDDDAKSPMSTESAAIDKVQKRHPPAAMEGSATDVKDVVVAFKAFTATEKLRAQEHQRQAARHSKAVKLNDLKKFAQSFKLHTPVPKDLVSILAKDKVKQEKIVEKALRTVEELKDVPKPPEPSPPPQPAEPKQAKQAPRNNQAPPTAPSERQNQRGNRQSPNFSQSMRGSDNRDRGGQQMPVGRQGQPPFSQRLAAQYNRQPPLQQVHMQDPRIPVPMPNVASPTGRFKPNPAAHTFLPTATNSSSSSPVRGPDRPRPGDFWEGRRPILAANRVPLETNYNPIPRMLVEVEGKEEYALNGCIFKSHLYVHPVWGVPEENSGKTYVEYLSTRPVPPSPQPQVVSPQAMPMQHQVPIHLQASPIPAGHTPHHTPRHAPVQPHMAMGPNGPQHFEDPAGVAVGHRMQYSASTSSVHQSPRPMMSYMAGGPYGQGPPVQMYGGAPYGMSPGGGHPMNMRQVSGGHGFMPPSGPAAAMGGHQMAPQQSSGPYMNHHHHGSHHMNSQGGFASPVPAQAFMHNVNGPGPQPGSGFPSPRPATMMAHQGSQQGIMYPPGPPGQHQGMYPSKFRSAQLLAEANRPKVRGGGPPYGGPMPGQIPTSGPPGMPLPPPPHGFTGNSPHQHQPMQFPPPQGTPHRGTPSGNFAHPVAPPPPTQAAAASAPAPVQGQGVEGEDAGTK